MPDGGDRGISRATVARLPRYLGVLDDLGGHQATISSDDLAAATDVTAANVRRDLSHLGFPGVRGVGYEVERLRSLLRRELGLTADVGVAIIGAGNLGRALANYGGFRRRGFRVAGLYDIDVTKVGTEVAGVPIRSLADLDTDVVAADIAIAIIATPATVAQEVAERVAGTGVGSILNFAPVRLRLSEGVEVRQVDLSTELQILSYYRSRR